jgi:glycerophosphoryl diester phosphodiesterase
VLAIGGTTRLVQRLLNSGLRKMIRYRLEKLLQFLADGVYASIPQSPPTKSALLNCKIVSHRGEHDNKTVKENTLTAFDRVLDQGIWGIELDIHWTRDLQPVVIHDLDCRRVFGSTVEVNKVTLEELRTKVPEIPSLDQIIQRYGKKIHLMVEIKTELFSDLEYQQARLKELFSCLEPGIDFHILALAAELFELVSFLPGQTLLPVAEFNISAISENALQNDYAGICGQYLLISENTIRKHSRRKQKIGTGFARSRFCFYRELNRGVEWIFTNHALKLHSMQQELLKR